MIVAVTRIVMLMVWLGLFVGTVLLTALAVRFGGLKQATTRMVHTRPIIRIAALPAGRRCHPNPGPTADDLERVDNVTSGMRLTLAVGGGAAK